MQEAYFIDAIAAKTEEQANGMQSHADPVALHIHARMAAEKPPATSADEHYQQIESSVSGQAQRFHKIRM